MTTPADTEPATPPPEPEWVHISDPPVASRSESDRDDGERGRPVGQWVAGGGSAAALGGVGLFQAFGPVGLAAGAVTAAGGAAVYGYHRVRSGRQSGFKMSRSRTRATRSTSRLGSVGKGLGKGKGPKLSGGRGPKLGGGRGGPKLGKGGGPKLGRGGGKLLGGKGAKLGGGKAGKLGGGRAGKLLGGGRGSKLGGKAGLGLGKGRKTTSRLGSVGKSGGKLLGRGGKSGLGLGKRGGKLLGGKGKAGVGRWSKSTGAGAGVLGSKFGRGAKKTGGKLRAAALRTKAGQRTSKGFKAAKAAMKSTMPGKGRWKNMHRAARAAMTSSRNPFARWAASIAAALAVLTAMGHEKWKARKAKAAQTAEPQEETAKKPRRCTWCGKGLEEDEVREVVLQGLPCTVCPTCYKPHDPHRQQTSSNEAYRRINEDVNDHGTGAPMPDPDPTHHAASGRRVYTEGKFTMGQSPLTMAAGEFQVAAGRYTPQDMHEARDAIREIPDIPRYLAQGLQTFTKRMQDEYPIHPAVVEQLGEMYVALGRMATMAEQIPATFERVHEAEIRRRETPRRGEEKWDVGR